MERIALPVQKIAENVHPAVVMELVTVEKIVPPVALIVVHVVETVFVMMKSEKIVPSAQRIVGPAQRSVEIIPS
jgi:hypothetical protein